MTDKQIIIDGVDVNALYSDQIACMNRYEVANLFIKTVEQLKAKEQECEELKEEVSLLKEINLKLQPIEDVRSLEKCYLQQLDQLKKELEQEKAWHKTADEISKANSEYTKQLKQTLTEIKEIAELKQKQSVFVGETVFEQILQKISEVLE